MSKEFPTKDEEIVYITKNINSLEDNILYYENKIKKLNYELNIWKLQLKMKEK